jgi:succinyl-diaminopimelate desuccinylase
VTSLAERLAARTLELVDIRSESGHEEAIRSRLLELVPSALTVSCATDEAYLFATESRKREQLVVLAGHYDTVPAQGNVPGRLAHDAVHGLGASDMKGGVAVALELTRDLVSSETFVDVALVLFGREELPAEHDPLPDLISASPVLRDASLVVLLEPTDGIVHAGCLGNVIARLAFHGRSGHSARPWDADNAIARAVDGLGPLLAVEPREAIVSGLRFAEVLSITRIDAGIADNVVPGIATATLNLRYPPDRTPDEAEALLQSLVPEGATLEIVSHARAGQVVGGPLVDALLAAGAERVEAKQAWTNVADFTAAGIPAINFGPGHTRYAHRADERVDISALVHAYETLERFLRSDIGEDAT